MISMICAIGKNGAIGLKNRLLWDLPADLKHFKKVTMGRTVIMGQKTFESIGKLLPGRKNIILSLDPNYKVEECQVSDNLNEIADKYKEAEEEVFIIGGASIYKQFIQYAGKMYLTLVDDSPEADVFFPEFNWDDWDETERIDNQPDKDNPYQYSFVTLQRKKAEEN